MRNTITINGVSSSTIAGLIIQELPPITKPMMRTDIEEIDGRAGDIVTKLGYSAYDKPPFRIGLYGSYDINEVIAFFAQNGTITFSNEPDKYYLFDMLQQIDFERLVRFRTAEVSVHVQPYKYPIETSEYAEPVTSTTSPVSVTNHGNTTSTPQYTISGTGDVALYLDGYQILEIALGTDDTITIDVGTMDATANGALRNRSVTGDYSLLALAPGEHTVSWTGTVTSVEITNYTRWI